MAETLKSMGSWKGTSEELQTAKKYFSGMTSWQILVIFGIAISGLATFVNTYDAASGINAQIQTCMQTGTLQQQLNTEFIVLIVLSCVAIVLGIILAWFMRNAVNSRRVMTLGVIIAGICGILYAISIKLSSSTMSSVLKAGLSWTVFIGFLVAGYFISSKNLIVAPLAGEPALLETDESAVITADPSLFAADEAALVLEE